MQKYWPEKRYRGKDSIWVALNRVNQQEVILKFFPMDHTEEYKVSREAYTMKYLHNEDPKHFLELYDYFEDGNENQYTIAMEKADCSLEELVNERGYLSEEEAVPVIREILNALQVMHKNNFIHRDLKLSNVLLRDKNDLSSVAIIDFGETIDRTEEYYITGVVGTLHYMAPEILKKKKYYKPVDLWALGIIVYRLLTGYFPFITEGDNHSKQLKAILNNDVSYLRHDNTRLSNKAIDFINCLLDVDPQNRMGIQTALDHPFLNPEFEGEFVPYKPIPKPSNNKKLTKNNAKNGTAIKRLLTKAVRKNKNIIAKQEKVISSLFSKPDTEANNENDTEEVDTGSKIQYSKTCVNPRINNDPFMRGTQTINRVQMKHSQQDNIPSYLNITLGRNGSNNNQKQYNNNYNDEYDYDNVKYSNSYVPQSNTTNNVNNKTKGYVPPTGNTAGNVNYDNSGEYLSPSGNTAGNCNEQYNDNGYSNNYASYGNNDYNNNYNNNNYNDNNNYNNNDNNNNYQKPPKTAGNSIDSYGNFQNINNFEGKNSNSNRRGRAHSDSTRKVDHDEEYYQNYNKGNKYSVKDQISQKHGNEIRKSNTVNGPSLKSRNSPSPLHEPLSTKSDDNRHCRRDNDSIHSYHRKASSSGSHQSYERGNRRNDNDYDDSDHSRRRHDNDYDSDHSRRRHDNDSDSDQSRRRHDNDYDSDHGRRRHDNDYDSDHSRRRYDDDSNSHHRKTNFSGSRPRYEDEDSYGHHRGTSSGSRQRYDDEDSYNNRRRNESSPTSKPHISPLSGSKNDNYSKQYNSKRPSPLVNAATIKNSIADDKYRSKNKESGADSNVSKSSKKNILPIDIKLKIDARPKKLPPVISNHPTRNSSLY